MKDMSDERRTRRPIVLEYSDDDGKTWKPKELCRTVKLCPDQIGICIDGGRLNANSHNKEERS